VTFSSLAAGETLTIAGRTLIVKAGQTLTAAEAVQAYASATLPTALVPKVTVSGALVGYTLTAPAANATAVTLTSTTANSNVPDLVVTGSPKVSMVVTDGAAAARTETATVTFSSLAAGEALTIAGRTLTVKAGQTLTAAEAVQAYASATLPTALVPKVTVSGALAGYSLTAPAANATSLTLTSTTPNSNVTDLAATGTGAVKASIVVQQGIAAPRSESVVVTFNPLLSNDTLTIAGRTLTVKAGQTLTAVEAVQAFSLATLPPALVPKVTVSGATPSALTGYTLTAPAANATSLTLTSTTANTNVPDLQASGTPKVAVSITQGVSSEVTTLSFQTSVGSDGKFSEVNYTTPKAIPVAGIQSVKASGASLATTTLGPINPTATKVVTLTDSFEPDPEQPLFMAFDSLAIMPGTSPSAAANLFLYSSTGGGQNLTSTNALRLVADSSLINDIRSLIERPNAGVFVVKDAKNYHLILTDNGAKNTLALNPIDIVISPITGRVISREKLDHSSLNYLLNQSDIGRMYDLAGGLLATENSLAYIEEDFQLSGTSLRLYGVEQKAFDTSGKEVTKSLGLVLSKSADPEGVTASNSYYFGSNFLLNDLVSRDPSVFEIEDTLVIVWDDRGSADPIYMRVDKGSALAIKDKLSLHKLLNLESELGVDLDGDGNENGSISYAAVKDIKLSASATTSQTLYKTYNDVFFLLKSGISSFPSSRLIDRGDLSSNIELVSSSRLRQLEVLNSTDLNSDGVEGTGVLSTVIENENFSIYKTTAGDMAWSSNRGLDSGDQITDAVEIVFGVPFSAEDQEIIETSPIVVASIQQSGRVLSIAAQIQDPLTGTTILKESNFLFDSQLKAYTPSSTTAVPAGPAPSITYTYGYSTPERQVFLARELYYDFDLNGDGLIGDAISEQLATNDVATVYRTAAGAVYVSSDPTRNPGDSIEGAYLLYDLSNCPDRVDAAVFTYNANNAITGARIFYSDIDNVNPDNNKYYSESFALQSGKLQSISKALLQPHEVLQTEILNKIDINNDGVLGDLVESRKFSSDPDDSDSSFGVYQLKTKFNNNPILITAKDGDAAPDEAQPTSGVVYLKNAAGSANPFWSTPKYKGVEGNIVAAGQNSLTNDRVQIVVEDKTGKNAFYLVNFDQEGGTVKPNGTLMSPLQLYNSEIILNTDISKDGRIGDSVSKIAASDSFGLYQLNRSGFIALTKENSWVEDGLVGTQQSINFVSLKNTNGSTWLPFGWKQQLKSDGAYSITKSSDAASVISAGIKPDGSSSVFLSRNISTPNGIANTIYEVSFSNTGTTKNPTGVALKPAEFYSAEMRALADLNGDSFVGKPFLGLPVKHAAVEAKPLIFEFRGYEWFEDRLVAVASSKFSGKQFTVKAANQWSSSDSALEIFDQKSALVSRIKTPAGFQIVLGGGEFTGDGVGDFATVDWAKNQLLVYRGNDKGQFVPHQQIGITFEDDRSRPKSHGVVADFNNDGLSDIALLQPSSGRAQFKDSDVLGIYLNQKGRLVLSDTVILGSDEYTDISTGDLNKDGFSDLVLVGSGNGSLKIALSQKGVFTSAGKLTQEFDLSGIYKPDHVRIGDINNDGNQDLVFGSENSVGSGLIQTFLGSGSGAFTDAQILSESIIGLHRSHGGLNAWTMGFELKDVNQDKQLDLILRSGVTYLNVSNVVDGTGAYNFKSVREVDTKAFALDYNAREFPMKFRMNLDSRLALRDAYWPSASDLLNVPYVTSGSYVPSGITFTFDSRGGVAPQIAVPLAPPVYGSITLENSGVTGTKYLDHYPGQEGTVPQRYFHGQMLAGALVPRNDAPIDFFVGSSGHTIQDAHFIQYLKGDKLFFNEPGIIQVYGFAIPASWNQGLVRLFFKPAADRVHNDAPLEPNAGITMIDILVPVATSARELKAWDQIDTVSELNSMLGDSQFINLTTNKLTESVLVPKQEVTNSDGAFFDFNGPRIFQFQSYGKFDKGDVIDFGGAFYDQSNNFLLQRSTTGTIPRIIEKYNQLVSTADPHLNEWFEYGSVYPNKIDAPKPLILQMPTLEMFTVDVQSIAPWVPSALNREDYAAVTVNYKGWSPLAGQDPSELYAAAPILTANGDANPENAGLFWNFQFAREYIYNYSSRFDIVSGNFDLMSILSQSDYNSSMTLVFDKSVYPGIESVDTVQELISLVGVSNTRNLDITDQ
jgi:hypothetical protein